MARAPPPGSLPSPSPHGHQLDFFALLQLIIAWSRKCQFFPFLRNHGSAHDFIARFRQLRAIFWFIRVVDFLFHKCALACASSQPLSRAPIHALRVKRTVKIPFPSNPTNCQRVSCAVMPGSTGCVRTHPLHECGFQKRKPPQERACVRFVFLTAHHSKSRSDSLAYNKLLIKRVAALSEP